MRSQKGVLKELPALFCTRSLKDSFPGDPTQQFLEQLDVCSPKAQVLALLFARPTFFKITNSTLSVNAHLISFNVYHLCFYLRRRIHLSVLCTTGISVAKYIGCWLHLWGKNYKYFPPVVFFFLLLSLFVYIKILPFYY